MYYRVRFSYRKCLTHYMNAVFDENVFFLSRKEFADHLKNERRERFLSINNQVFWPEREIFRKARMVHLIRHPKDLVVSGYHYHKKGAEFWTDEPISRLALYQLSFELDNIYNDEEKRLINPEMTYRRLLNSLPFEKGIMTEMVWLKYVVTFNPVPFFESPLMKTFRFEDIVDEPVKRVEDICRFWLLNEEKLEYFRKRAAFYDKHPNYEIRDRSAYQYQQIFSPSLNAFFERHFGRVATRLGYPA